MRLKNLEVFGFKSFADRMKFDFEEGVTAIVGPNGCGKSNVFDALRWVMGEQSAKSLRGGEMNDVIFGGTARRKPLGYAEVAVTFDNADRRLPIDQDEVSIGRRLYRTGESEYFVNKELGRLRDVRELLMDTGVGTSSYCFIAQGQIHQLLEADPKQRRLVFEEAAGISKYRTRKAAALRKLDRVETNLQTLASVREEVDKRLRSVARQAQKARRHQRVIDELKGKQVLLALLDYRELTREKAGLDEELSRMRETEAAAAARAAAADARLTEVELTETELERAASGKEEERARLQAELQRIEGEIRHAESRAQELADSCVTARGEMEAQASRFEEDRAAREGAREAVGRIESSFADEEAALRLSEAAARAADAHERELAEKVEACRTRAMEAVRRRAETESRLAAAEGDVKKLSARAERLEGELARVCREFEAARAREQEAAGSCTKLGDRIEAAGRALETARQEAVALERRGAGLDELARSQKADVESQRNRLALLAEFDQRRDGVSPGARAVLEAARREEMRFGRVYGLIADLIKVNPEVEVAIEAALGGRASDIIVDSGRTAARAIDFLKKEKLGRTFLIPLDGLRETVLLPKKLLRHPGAVGRAFDLIEYAPRFRPAMEYLLGRVLVVRDRDAAVELARSAGAGTRMVTLDGELVDGNGPYKGGAGSARRPGLITRRREIDRLRSSIVETERMLAALGTRRGRIDERRRAARARADSLAAQLRQVEGVFAEAKAEQSTLVREERRLEQRQLASAVEYDEATRDRDEAKAKIEGLAEEAKALTGAERGAHAEVERLKTEIERARGERARHEKELADRRAVFAALEEKRAALSRELESVERRIAERERALETRRGELGTNQARSEELRARAESMRAELSAKSETLEHLARETNEARSRRAELRGGLESLRQSLRELRAEHGRTQTDMNESRIRESELELRIASLEESAASEFGVTLAEKLAEMARSATEENEGARSEGDVVERAEQIGTAEGDAAAPLEDRPDAGAASAEDVGAAPSGVAGGDADDDTEEAAAGASEPTSLDEVDVEALRSGIETLRRKLDNIGRVNPYALEEQRDLRGRSEFLKTQFDDLTKAKTSLRDVIGRINRKSRALFRETYDAVRGHFQELFRKLFGGGKADIVLEGSDDILEAGIEVVARPPGREALKLSLLSGGQKAMTTIALLFAIFRAKPSPFCVLDEVDAPLDDANVDRFNMILEEYTPTTQFVVVTHNKATMAYAKVLYGITMQEPGVSKKVSIRLEEVDAHLKKPPASTAGREGQVAAPAKAA